MQSINYSPLVTAGMVNDPADYRWTSYRWHALGERNALITDHALYEGIAREAGERQAAYRALFRAHLDDEAVDDIRKALNGRQPLGNECFREQVSAIKKIDVNYAVFSQIR